MAPRHYVTVKKTSARKSLHHFLEVLDVKPKTASHILCATKSKCKANRDGIMLRSNIRKKRGNSKIN